MPQRNTIVLAQCESRLSSAETLDRVLKAAMAGCQAVFEVMSNAVRERETSLHTANQGTCSMQPHLGKEKGWEKVTIHSGQGATLKNITDWLEAILFELGGGPGS